MMSKSDESGIVWSYAAHQDSEEWEGPHATREEAIAAGLADDDLRGCAVWVVDGARLDPAEAMPTASTILGWMPDNAADREWGEVGIDRIDDARKGVSADGRAELDALLAAWARKWCPVVVWRVTGKPEKVREASDDEQE